MTSNSHNMNHTAHSAFNLDNKIKFNNDRHYKSVSMDNDELHNLREEVSRLKHQVNKISFHGNSDDLEAIKVDLGVVRENKATLMGEKQKVQDQYKVLLKDKEQFKEDLEAFKNTDKREAEYDNKKLALKKIKQLLDSKITNVNACINSLADAELKLNAMEKELDKRLRDEENSDMRSEFSINERADMSHDVNAVWNIGGDHKLQTLYNHISEVKTSNNDHLKMIDRDIKSRLSSNFSRKLMQTKSKSNRSCDVKQHFATPGGG